MTQRLQKLLPALSLVVVALVLAGCSGPNFLSRLGNFWTWGICSAIIVILDLIALFEIAGSNREFGNKLLWALLIIFFPVGGLILYYLFGR